MAPADAFRGAAGMLQAQNHRSEQESIQGWIAWQACVTAHGDWWRRHVGKRMEGRERFLGRRLCIGSGQSVR